MKITFCGHSRIDFSDYNKSFLKELLIECIIKDPQSIFYLGGYGDFDSICLNILKELQLTFKDIKIIFVTPYISSTRRVAYHQAESFYARLTAW